MRPEHSGLTCAHVHDEFRTCASPSIYDPKLDPAFSDRHREGQLLECVKPAHRSFINEDGVAPDNVLQGRSPFNPDCAAQVRSV